MPERLGQQQPTHPIVCASPAPAPLSSCVCAGVGTYVTGVFGMNLDNTVTIQHVYGVFEAVWVGSTFTIVALFCLIYWYLDYAKILPKRVVIPVHLQQGGRIQKIMLAH